MLLMLLRQYTLTREDIIINNNNNHVVSFQLTFRSFSMKFVLVWEHSGLVFTSRTPILSFSCLLWSICALKSVALGYVVFSIRQCRRLWPTPIWSSRMALSKLLPWSRTLYISLLLVPPCPLIIESDVSSRRFDVMNMSIRVPKGSTMRFFLLTLVSNSLVAACVVLFTGLDCRQRKLTLMISENHGFAMFYFYSIHQRHNPCPWTCHRLAQFDHWFYSLPERTIVSSTIETSRGVVENGYYR